MNQNLYSLAVEARARWEPEGHFRYICNCLWSVYTLQCPANPELATEYFTLRYFVSREINEMPSVEHLMGYGNAYSSDIPEEVKVMIAEKRIEIWDKMIRKIKEGEL